MPSPLPLPTPTLIDPVELDSVVAQETEAAAGDEAEEEYGENEPVENGSVEDEAEDDGTENGLQSNPDDIFTQQQNPLNPLESNTFEQLLQLQINDDSWSAMVDPLPCLEATEQCIRELQELAVQNSFVLQGIDQRLELINEQIEVARQNNQQSIRMGVFEPFVQELIRLETVTRVPDPNNQPAPGSIVRTEQEGFLDRIGNYFNNPLNLVNTALSFIGLPLFHGISGGSTAQQTREIAIADLQVKVAEVERQREEMANDLRERVLTSVLEFETTRRQFQAWQAMGARSQLRNEVLTLNYRFVADSMTTPEYLSQLNTLDGNYLQMFQAWAQMRTQLTQIKVVVLGAEGV